MEYEFYLFSKLAEIKCSDVMKVSEYDLRFDVIKELYWEYSESNERLNTKIGTYESIILFLDRKENSKIINRLHDEIRELKWRISAIVEDVEDIKRLNKANNTNNTIDLDLYDTYYSNIDVAADLNDKECLRWRINGSYYCND